MKRNGKVVTAKSYLAAKKANQQTGLRPAPKYRNNNSICLWWSDGHGSAHTYLLAGQAMETLKAIRAFIAKGGNPWAILQDTDQFMTETDIRLWAEVGGPAWLPGCPG